MSAYQQLYRDERLEEFIIHHLGEDEYYDRLEEGESFYDLLEAAHAAKEASQPDRSTDFY
jgi:hypothetical protein